MYKGLKLRATLDRLSISQALIRDYKTTSDLSKFMYDMVSDPWGYRISMSFYYMLVKMIRGVDCDVSLEVVQSSYPYPSAVMRFTKAEMEQTLAETVFPALDKLATVIAEWKENGDEAVWMEKPLDRSSLYKNDFYPHLQTAIQTELIYI